MLDNSKADRVKDFLYRLIALSYDSSLQANCPEICSMLVVVVILKF